MNNWNGIGRLTKAPESRYTQSGKAVTSFDIAVDREFKDAAGNRQTDFIPVVVWGKLAEICANNLDKGRLVGVTGTLQIRSYEAQDGQKRRVAEIVAEKVKFLDKAKDGQAQPVDCSDIFPEDQIGF
jgi:single-strand DNA-binding protein